MEILGNIIEETFSVLNKEDLSPFLVLSQQHSNWTNQKDKIQLSCLSYNDNYWDDLASFNDKAFEDCKFSDWLQGYFENFTTDSIAIVNKKISELDSIFNEYAIKKSSELERVFNGNLSNKIEVFLLKIIYDHNISQLNDKTIFSLENYLERHHSEIINHKTSKFIAEILVNNVINYNVAPFHATFLSDALAKNYFSQETSAFIINKFIENKTINFEEQVFKNFESLLSGTNINENFVLFIAYGVQNHVSYTPNFDLLAHFEKYLDNGSIHKQLLFNTVAKILEAKLCAKELTNQELNFLQAKIDHYMDNGYRFSSSFIKSLLNLYTKTLNYFSDTTISVIQDYYNSHLDIFKEFASDIIEILKTRNDLETEIIKDIIFIIERLFDIDATNKDNQNEILSLLPKYINNADLHTRRLATKLLQKLGISDYNQNNYLNVDFEAFVSSLQSSEHLINSIERIKNYNISKDAIDRNGFTIKDVFTNDSPEEWELRIKGIYDDNNFFVEDDFDELSEEIKALNLNKDFLDLVESSYIKKVLSDIKLAESRLHFSIEFTFLETLKDENNNVIYVYSQNDQVYLNLNKQTHTFIDQNHDEYINLKKILNSQQTPLKRDLQNIYSFVTQLTGKLYGDLGIWEIDDFVLWKNSINEVNDNNIAEILAVLKYVAYKTLFKEDHYPRDIQIIAVLSLFKGHKSRLIQVITGEGKSLIIDLFNALKVLDKHQVYVVASSKELAKRDAEDQVSFYDLLGISSGHNIYSTAGIKNCYLNNVTYGDLFNFIVDDLKDIESGTRNGQGYDTIVIDEVDNLLIDLNSMMVKLTSNTPGFFYLKQILMYMWSIYPNILSIAADKCHPESPTASLKECEQLVRLMLEEYAGSHLLDYNTTDRKSRIITIPQQLEAFAKEHYHNWIDSLITALFYSEDKEYIVKHLFTDIFSPQSNNEVRKVQTVDFSNTGTVNSLMQWSNGLHQFLSLKHSTFITAENLVGTFMTYVGYFIKFKGSVYGLTGTLGTETHTDFLSEFYDLDFVKLPTFKKSKLAIFPEIITDDEQVWQSKIIEIAQKRAFKDSRAVLIITYTIKQAEDFYEVLSKNGNLNLIKYVHGTQDEREKVEKYNIEKNTVIIATNLAGRGSDIKITREVEKNGGLHVILTFFPDSIRVLNQAFGRAARKGEFGSAQLIIFNSDTDCNDIKCLSDEQDANELLKFQQEEVCNLPEVQTKDWLFNKYQNLVTALNSPTGYNISLVASKPKIVNSNQIYVFSNADNIYILGQLPDGKGEKEIEIGQALQKLDNVLCRHIKNLLSDKRSASSLNKQDLELIYFITAQNGFNLSDEPAINRISALYQSLYNSCKHSNKCDISYLLSESQNSYLDFTLKTTKLKVNEDYVKDIYLYVLWKRYLELYNRNAENLQLKAYWEMWFYHQQSLLKTFINKCDYNDREEAKILLNDLQSELEASFSLFAKEIQDKYNSINLFNNPKYLLDKAYHYNNVYYTPFHQLLKRLSPMKELLKEALNLTSKAIDLDEELAWSSYNARATLRVLNVEEYEKIIELNDNNIARATFIKSETLKDLENSLRILKEVRAMYESAYMALAKEKLLEPKSELMAQYVYQRKLFILFEEKLEDAIKVVREAYSDTNKMIMIESVIKKYDLINQVKISVASTASTPMDDSVLENLMNVTSPIGDNLSFLNSSMLLTTTIEEIISFSGFIPAVYTSYNLIEPEQDWFGTLFSAIAGVFQVFAGFTVIAMGGPFATSFGLSMLMSGIGDVISSGISVIEGQAIDLDQYFQSKAVTYAIAITTAGMMKAVGKSIVVGQDQLEKDIFLNEITKKEMFQYALKLQVASTIVGYAAGYAAEKFVDKNDSDPEGKAEEAANWIISTYAEKLLVIFIADSLNTEADMLSNLESDANTAVNKCSKRFHDIPSNLGKSVFSTAAGLGGSMWGAAAAGAAGGVIGIIKYSEFTNEFKSKYGPYIDAQYNSALNYLKSQSSSELLMKNIHFNIEQEESIAIALKKEHFGDNNLRDCHRINNENFNATNFLVDLEFVKAACNRIYTEYQSYIENLRSYLKQAIHSGMTSTLKHDVASPLFNQAGHFIYDEVGDWLKALKKQVTNNNQQDDANDSAGNTNKQSANFQEEIEEPEDEHADKQKPIKLNVKTDTEVSVSKEKPNDGDQTTKGKKVYDAPIEPKRQPTIEIFARPVKIPFGWALHSYTLYTYSDGTVLIHTGFPEDGNMVTGNLKFIECHYTEEYYDVLGDDLKRDGGPKHWSLDSFALNSDAELDIYLEKARSAGTFINSGSNGKPFDYDFCITENCYGANSNTVQKEIHNAMGTADRWINDEKLKDFNLPGIRGKFYDGPIDDFMRKYGEELQKEQP